MEKLYKVGNLVSFKKNSFAFIISKESTSEFDFQEPPNLWWLSKEIVLDKTHIGVLVEKYLTPDLVTKELNEWIVLVNEKLYLISEDYFQ